jgi:dTDP-4-dehydrorhamnose 3,5-epimerase
MTFAVTPSRISDVLIIEPNLFRDQRGWFCETFNESQFCSIVGRKITFVQDNHSLSNKGVLRGLHYQTIQAQGKLVRVTLGAVFDVAVDLRKSSSTYGKWVGEELSANNKKQHWIPPGFAHGFLVLSDEAELLYKVTDYWHPESEQTIYWDDPTMNIEWPQLDNKSILSLKDLQGVNWDQAPKFD